MTHFTDLIDSLSHLDPSALQRLLDFAKGTEGTLWIAGNGGSYANATHWACDLTKAAGRRAQSLGNNPSLLTAWSNDWQYSSAFAEEFTRFSRAGDRLICMSCSGTSMNIIVLLRAAWLAKIPRAILTGRNTVWPTPVDLVVNVPSDDYGVIEDTHMAIGHWLTKKLSGE